MKCPRFVAFCAWLIALVLIGFGCGSGSGTGTGGTGGTTCDLTACPPPSSECVEAVCSSEGACTEAPKAEGTPAATQIAGDCKQNVCQLRMVVAVADDLDVAGDENECTDNACDKGVPVTNNAPIDTPCGADGALYCDGNGACSECTSAAHCSAPPGACMMPACVAGVCGTQNQADGSSCDDGDACTQTDACQSGACMGGNAVTCAALDPCHDAGTCNAATGLCDNPSKADGTSCDDGDACTQTDACQSGACTGNPMTCVLATCVAGACVDDPIAYIKASNTGVTDYFGRGVALSADGNTLAVGAMGEDSNATGIGGDQTDNSAGNAGAVYVYVRNGGVWTQQAYIKASNTGGNDWFGQSVALSDDGNTLAVGAPYEDSNATGVDGDQTDNSAQEAGAVYVFTRSGGLWTQQAYVKASNTNVGDEFGHSVALSGDGNTLAVGAKKEASNAIGIDGNQANNSTLSAGAVYVFTRNGAVWSQQAYIKASNTAASDGFGHSVALSGDGNTLAVGANNEDSNATGIGGDQTNNSAANSGAVYVFTRSGAVWSQQTYVKASNTGAQDWFGFSVALSADGNTLAVSANGEGSNATGVNGDQTDNSAQEAGAVYVFTRSGAVWSQQAYVKASNTDADELFGTRVVLSGDGTTLAVGANHEDSNATGIGGDQINNSASNSGAVYVFTRSGAVWSQQAYVKASNTAFGDFFGIHAALSADGTTLAVGAYQEDSNATGVGGDQTNNSASSAGAVYVY